MRRSALALLLATVCPGVVLLAVAGCGGPKLPPMAKVSGVVTLDSKPVPMGTVQFIPDKKKGTPAGPPAVGQLDAQGRFELVTAGVPGALVGWHQVRVRAQDNSRDTDLEGGATPAPWIIPFRYNNPAQSRLAAEVKADEDNFIELKLTARE